MSVLKKILRVLGVCLSVFMIGWYFVSAIVNIGSIFGTVFFICLGLCCIFSDKFFYIIRKIKSYKVGKVIFNIVTVLFSAAILYVFVLMGCIIFFSMRTPQSDSTLVVLGCQVNGNVPSMMLRMRLDAAYDYLKNNPDVKCVVSGGQGNNEYISEAECMYNWLTKKGIEPDRIYMEDKSTDTRENLEFSKQIIKKEGLNENISIVTDWYHEFRAAIIANKLGISCGSVPASTPFYLSANFTTRELLALTNEIIFH